MSRRPPNVSTTGGCTRWGRLGIGVTAVVVTLACLLLLPGVAAALAPGDFDPAFGAGGQVFYPWGAGSRLLPRSTLSLYSRTARSWLAGYATDKDGKLRTPGRTFGGQWLTGSIVRGWRQADQAARDRRQLGVIPSARGRPPAGRKDSRRHSKLTAISSAGWLSRALEPERQLRLVIRRSRKVFADKTTTDPGETGYEVPNGYAMALQPDGKIVLGGTDQLYHANELFVARLNGNNGSFDSSFADDGVLRAQLKQRWSSASIRRSTRSTLQPNGKILLSGSRGQRQLLRPARGQA